MIANYKFKNTYVPTGKNRIGSKNKTKMKKLYTGTYSFKGNTSHLKRKLANCKAFAL